MKNLRHHLLKYFPSLTVPEISKDEAEILAEEIDRMVEILEKDPDISYSDLWNKIHEI